MAEDESKLRRKKNLCSLVIRAAKKSYEGKEDGGHYIAPYSPSPMEMVCGVWECVELKSSDCILEIGCGDARWIIEGVKKFECRAIGIEIDIKLCMVAKKNVQDNELESYIDIIQDDIMDPRFRIPNEITIVIVYAFTKSLVNIKHILERQVDQQTKVISVGVSMKYILKILLFESNNNVSLSSFVYRDGFLFGQKDTLR